MSMTFLGGSAYYNSLGDLLEREKLFGVCADCGSVKEQDVCGSCEPEWVFGGCVCDLLDSDLWAMIAHYARVHEAHR